MGLLGISSSFRQRRVLEGKVEIPSTNNNIESLEDFKESDLLLVGFSEEMKEKNSQLNQSQIETILDTFSESVSRALKNNNSVEIRGLGKWYVKKLKENFNARNPSTNELIYKPERVKVRFRASKNLKKIINE